MRVRLPCATPHFSRFRGRSSTGRATALQVRPLSSAPNHCPGGATGRRGHLKSALLPVRVRLGIPEHGAAQVAQLADALLSKGRCSEFESRLEHQQKDGKLAERQCSGLLRRGRAHGPLVRSQHFPPADRNGGREAYCARLESGAAGVTGTRVRISAHPPKLIFISVAQPAKQRPPKPKIEGSTPSRDASFVGR